MKTGWGGGLTHSPDDTIRLGKEFAQFLEPGDVIGLYGDLAAGKTTFMKGVAKGLGYNENVTSPTFTLINEYPGELTLIHLDCYREDNIKRWIELGLMEYLYDERLVFIEWPELISELLPDTMIKLHFKHHDSNSRLISIQS